MKILSRYILGQVAKPIGTTLGIMLFVLLLERTTHIIDTLLGSGGFLNYVPLMLAFVLPQFASVVLPFSFFFGVLIGLQRLGRDGELTAIENSGQGAHNLHATLTLLTLLVAFLSAFSLSFLQPYGRYGQHFIIHSVSELFLPTRLQSGAFTYFKNLTVFIDRISPDKKRAEQVFIFSYGPNDSWEAISSAGGSLVTNDRSRPERIVLHKGRRISGQILPGEGLIEPKIATSFETFQSIIKQEVAGSFRPRGKDERELTLIELWQVIDRPPLDLRQSEIMAEFNARIVRILSIFFLPALAVFLGRWRGYKSSKYAVLIGLVVLVVFNQTLDFGENLVETGEATPFLGLWLPFIVFGSATTFLFCRACLRVGVGLSFRSPKRPAIVETIYPNETKSRVAPR